jgi:alkylation response protein AidB-like acyl-CoA dehydrogenase
MSNTSTTVGRAQSSAVEAHVRGVLDAVCARRPIVEPGNTWGSGDEEIVGSALRINLHEEAEVAEARAFQAALFDAGLAWVRGPKNLGGAELDDEAIATLRAVAAEYATPDLHFLHVGQQIVAPAIEAFGSDAQKHRWLPAIWRGDTIGCQLFSEPDAGSDLASLTTRAVRDGDTWRITGQKVWSSGAHFSDVGELLARTDGDPTSRHRGLTMFLIDMDQPGVTVRPLRQMNGSAHFCEVFLDDVVVADDRRLGDVGQGWIVAQTSLTSERDGFGDDGGQLFDHLPRRLIDLVRHLGGADDPIRRNQLADVYSRDVIARLLSERMQHADGNIAAASASLVKLFATELDWRAAQIAASVLGPSISADDGEWGRYVWSRVVLGVPAPRIAGGTDQIQKNIVAERALGLPREPR